MENNKKMSSFLMVPDRIEGHRQSQVCLIPAIEENDSDSDVELVDAGVYNEIKSSSDLDAVEKTSDNSEAACIYLRLRPVTPMSNAYLISEQRDKLSLNQINNDQTNNNNKIHKNIEQQYSFSNIFDHFVPQKEVYEQCLYKRIKSEENFSILAYGTSGSGKTFTLLGTPDNPGIVPRALVHILTLYKDHIHPEPAMKYVNAKVKILDDAGMTKETDFHKRILSAANDSQFDSMRLHTECSFQPIEGNDFHAVIWISFAELYSEMVYDLLEAPSNIKSPNGRMLSPKRNNLKIMINNGEIFVKGLTSVYVLNSKEALQLLSFGLQRVNYKATAINENSSRSHCIFFVDILKCYCNGEIVELHYKFSDLAGSERVVKTNNEFKRIKEAQSINTSLLVLERCLDVANSNRSKRNADVIPVRESKLTQLLQAALLGKEKLAMIVSLAPTVEYLEENKHVLRFSSIAKNILYKKSVVAPKRTRYSLLNTFRQKSANNTAQVEDLMRQNLSLVSKYLITSPKQILSSNVQFSLRSELERLQTQLNVMQEDHVKQMRKQECDLRQYYEDLAKKTNDENLGRMQLLHDKKIEMLNKEHQYEKDVDFIEILDDSDICGDDTTVLIYPGDDVLLKLLETEQDA